MLIIESGVAHEGGRLAWHERHPPLAHINSRPCDPRAISHGTSRPLTGRDGQLGIAAARQAAKCLRRSAHRKHLRGSWSGAGSNCRPSAFSGWQTARPKTIGSVPYGSDFTPLTGPFSPGLPPRTPVPGSCAPCVITPHVHSAPPFADPPGDTPDPVSRADPDPWHGDDHLDHEVNEEDATALTGLRPGDGPLSIRARPSSLKHDCDRRQRAQMESSWSTYTRSHA